MRRTAPHERMRPRRHLLAFQVHQVLLFDEDVLQQRVGDDQAVRCGDAFHLQVAVERFAVELFPNPPPRELLLLEEREVLHEVPVQQAVGLGVLLG